MIEQDYIMREVQKMVQVLKVIIGLKQEQKFKQAIREIENAYKQFFNEDRKTIQASDIDGLKRLCSKEGEFSPDLAFALADIIKEEADILKKEGMREEAQQKFELSLNLYESAMAEEDAAVPVDIAGKMQKAAQELNE